MNNNYQIRIAYVLNKYSYFIHSVETVGKTKHMYIGDIKTNKVVADFWGLDFKTISEQISYNLALYGRI